MKKYLNCYKPTQKGLPGNKILISGRCHTVKAIYLSEQLKKACSNGYMTVVIDYGRTNSFSGILYCNGFQNQYIFVTEEDNYKPIEIPIHAAISKLRTHAQKLGYSHSDYARMTAFLNFLIKLETKLEPIDQKSTTIQMLLKKFSNQDKLDKILVSLVRNQIITREDAKDYTQTYFEYVSSGITADTLLNEINFMITPSSGCNAFSLSALHPGDAAVIYADENNSTDINDYMTRLWVSDLIEISKNNSILIVINTGNHSQINRTYELIETLSKRENVSLFYSSYDLFSGIEETKAKSFAKMFRYNLYGTHSGDSAKIISSMFGDHWITQFNYADTRNKRILGESMIDRILKTDYTRSVTTILVKENIIPSEYIVSLSPNQYVIFDTLTNTVQPAYI